MENRIKAGNRLMQPEQVTSPENAESSGTRTEKQEQKQRQRAPEKIEGTGSPAKQKGKEPGKDYNMKYAEMVEKAIEMIKNDDELMINLVDELDSWNGYADGFRCYDMYELDDLFCDCKVSEFLQKLAPDFDLRDDFFYDTFYGISSTSDKAELYRDNTDAGKILDNVLENLSHLYIDDSDFADLMSEIDNYTDEEDEKTA